MDSDTITLLKFSTPLEFPLQNIIASRPSSFKHLCTTTTDSCISTLYSLQNIQDNVTHASVIWESKHVSSITFSEDGGYILLVLDSYDLQILQICDEVTVVVEISVSQLEQLLQENNVSSDISSLVTVAFSSSHAILSVSGRWMVRFRWSGANTLQFAAAVEVPHCVAFTVSKETVYILTTGGNVLAVSTDHMRQLGSVNLFSLLPQDFAESPGCFLDLTVSVDGSTLAVVDDQDRLFLASISGAFLPCDRPATSVSDWDCGLSIASKSSTASVISNRSVASRVTAPGIEVLPTTSSHSSKRQKTKSTLYLSTWNYYIASLQKWKQQGKKPNSSFQLRLVDSAPSGLKIASMRLTVAGVLVWFAGPRGGIYRVRDVTTGTSLTECCVPPGSVLARGPGDVDTFLSPDRLWLHLCGVSREALLAKLLHCVDASSVGRLLQGEEWGGLAMPITTLDEGLRHQHMHVVRFALGLHAQAFKRVMEGKASHVEEPDEEVMLAPLDELFGAIRNYLRDEDRRTVFSEQLALLTLGHANALLQTVRDGGGRGHPGAVATQKIMSWVVELRQHLHVRAAVDDGGESRAAEWDWGSWPGMSEEEVVREAVSGGNVPLLLAFLVSCRGYTSCAAQQAVKRQVDTWVRALLAKEQVHQAREILANFYCGPDEELHEICVSSRDSGLRDYLARHLSSQGLLSEAELTAWSFLHRLEAVSLQHAEISGSVVPPDGGIVATVVPTTQHLGSLAIRAVVSQPEDWRKDVLTVMYFNTLDETLLDVVDGERAWACLLRHDRADLLLPWAARWFPEDGQPCAAHLDARLSAAFARWPLAQGMIDHVGSGTCTKVTKDVLLDHFASWGVFTDVEKRSVCSILMRLARCGKLQDMRTVLGSGHSSLGYGEFEATLVKFCTKHDLYHVALSCLRDSQVEVEGSEVTWWPLWREFRHGVGPGFLEATRRYLGMSLNPLVAVAESLYSGLPLIELPAARDVPLLDMALASSHCPSAAADVNLYQLLHSFCPFNVSRLFSWQHTHTPSNRTEEPPHFSEPSLMSKHGYKDTLSFLHYLKQGRPSFAASMFLVEQFKSHRKLSKKAAVTGSKLAHGLALRHFQDPCVTAACISFIEMLGRSSQPARVHLAAVNAILRHLDRSTGCGSSLLHQQQLSVLLRGLVQNSTDTCAEFLGLLEVALQEGAEHLGVVAALLHWQPAVQFARLHNLRLPSLFLEYCVRHDKWLIFVLFVHVYNYPTAQVLELTKLFTSARLREHIHLALSLGDRRQHKLEKHHSRSRLQQPDSNRTYYNKIGISNAGNTDKLVPEHGSPSQLSSSSSEDWGVAGEGAGPTECHLDDDSLFLTLLRCHGSADPHRSLLNACYSTGNPVYAVFACCYQPSSLVTCLCTWLGVSVGQLQCLAPWSAASAAQLAEEAVCKGHVSTLARCWNIFLPDNPLCAFLTFLRECVVLRTFEDSIISLKVFKAACINFHNVTLSTTGEAESMEGSFLHDSMWIAEMAVRLANAALSHCFSSLTHQRMFLHTLCRASFTEHFPVEAPDYGWLWHVSDCLTGSGVRPSWSRLLSCPVPELQSCLQQLLSAGRFSHALRLAEVAPLPCHQVLTAQCLFKFEQLLKGGHQFFVPGDTFFVECEAEFQQYEVDVEAAVGFFRLCASKVSTHKERYCLLRLALQWLKKKSCREAHNVQEDQLELEMWTCWLATDDTTLGSTDGCAVLRTSLAQLLDARRTVRSRIVYEQDAHRLELLIGLLLEKGDVTTACRLEATFQYSSKELGLLLTSLQLAEGTTSPYQLPAELRVMLSETSTGYQHRMLRLSSVSSLKLEGGSAQQGGGTKSEAVDGDPGLTQEQQETFSLLEGLAGHMSHAAALGRRVALCFRVAAALRMPFKNVLALEDPLGLLRTDCLEEPTADMLLVAGGLIRAEAATAEEVADLLCHKIVEAVCRAASQVPGEMVPCVVWGCNLNSSFHLLLDLCADPSLLGYKLLLAAADVAASTSDTLQQVVELIVRAHDCFSTACNMEGIVGILRRAQIISRNLLQREEWGLLVRLLTGVGRYTEMSYIFHMLKKNNRFEFLLGKGMDKVAGLKTAALDFLEKHYSEDKDTIRLVGLHFQLHGRVGSQCLQEGEARLASVAMPLRSCQRTCQLLTAAMLDFSQAAQYLLQADKLTAAMGAAHRAELVALQLSILSTSPADQTATCILRLSPDKVSHLITHTLSFPQACIVARAYGHPVDWGAALFQHCVVHGRANYLPDFSHSMRLTPALVEDVACRFQKETSISKDMVAQMKKLVSCVNNVEVRYRVASQLGFRDVVESLLSSSSLAYLKDTVWRSGFRQ